MSYIHGFDEIEQARLVSQAAVLEEIIFEKIDFKNPAKILEIGSGVGAQTEILLNRYPNTHVTGVELSEIQLNTAQAYISSKFDNFRYEYHQANAEELPFEDNSYDAIYICWVLEHVPNPQKIVNECFRVLKPNGIISITEVQNNTLWLIPKSKFLIDYWNKYNNLQLQMNGNPYVGIEIGNFIEKAGFTDNQVYTQTFLYDNNQAEKREIMVDYWTELMLSAFPELVKHGYFLESDKYILVEEMNKVKEANGVFHCAFVQCLGKKS